MLIGKNFKNMKILKSRKLINIITTLLILGIFVFCHTLCLR